MKNGFKASTALLLTVTIAVAVRSEVPCTTPSRRPGFCVDIRRCTNLYNIVTKPNAPPKGIANYISKAACTLPNVERSVCCSLAEVQREDESVVVLPTECGQAVTDRIAFGNVTKVFDYPWMAVLRHKTNEGDLIDQCGGTLIHKRYILTAAHCLRSDKINVVRLGEHDKSSEIDCNIYKNTRGKVIDRECAKKPVDYEIESFVIHENYQRPMKSNDIGLIRLNRDVEMDDHIHPICLPVTPELRSLQLDRYLVTGWGTTENLTGSDVLLSAVVPHVSNAECLKKWQKARARVYDTEMCAGGDSTVDSCRVWCGCAWR
ncbi:serine protease grass-like isoform X2 [Uranotaenia lowii]|uniref:serine protease grass-like isoform X2 n=1 Tax=Uranotaenia lowii TaxID=190385 RepID=UPI0024794173|nr:serine protease grass-like isoform X2 [Uranotaenia lowii]